jgi:hypothetical protein
MEHFPLIEGAYERTLVAKFSTPENTIKCRDHRNPIPGATYFKIARESVDGVGARFEQAYYKHSNGMNDRKHRIS